MKVLSQVRGSSMARTCPFRQSIKVFAGTTTKAQVTTKIIHCSQLACIGKVLFPSGQEQE